MPRWSYLLTLVSLLLLALAPACRPAAPPDAAEREERPVAPAAAEPPGIAPAEAGMDAGDATAADLPPDRGQTAADPFGGGTGTIVPITAAEPPPAAPRALADWLAELGGEHEPSRSRALEHLRSLGRSADGEIVPLLGDPRTAVRRGAAFVLLGHFDPHDGALVEAMIAALGDEDPTVRHIALQAVGQLDDEQLLPAAGRLSKMLADPAEQPHLRTQIARRLARLGSRASDALPQLAAMIEAEPDRNLRAAALNALARIAPPAEAAAAYRRVARSDEDAGLRRVAVERLGQLGPQAADALADLVAVLEDEDAAVRGAAAEALAGLGPPAVAPLVERLRHADREQRILAAFALGRIGPAARQAEPALTELLSTDDADLRAAVQYALLRVRGQW